MTNNLLAYRWWTTTCSHSLISSHSFQYHFWTRQDQPPAPKTVQINLWNILSCCNIQTFFPTYFIWNTWFFKLQKNNTQGWLKVLHNKKSTKCNYIPYLDTTMFVFDFSIKLLMTFPFLPMIRPQRLLGQRTRSGQSLKITDCSVTTDSPQQPQRERLKAVHNKCIVAADTSLVLEKSNTYAKFCSYCHSQLKSSDRHEHT